MTTGVILDFRTTPKVYQSSPSTDVNLSFGDNGPSPSLPANTLGVWGIGPGDVSRGAVAVRKWYTHPRVYVNLDFQTVWTGYTSPPSDDVPLSFHPHAPPGQSTAFPAGLDTLTFGGTDVKNWLTYTAPSGMAGDIGSPSIVNTALAANNATLGATQVFGALSVTFVNRPVNLSGFIATLFGTASLKTTPELRVTGIAPGVVPNPKIENLHREVGAVGWNNAVYGTGGRVSNFLNYLHPVWTQLEAFGRPTMEGGVRNAPMNGFATQAFGAHSVTLAQRQVYPQWFVDTRYGMPLMGYERAITGIGTDVSVFGSTLVWDNTQRPAMTGFDATLWGDNQPQLLTRYLGAKPVFEDDIARIGYPNLYNLRQYITQSYLPEQWSEGGIGDPIEMHVYNVNRRIDLVNNGIAPLFRQIPLTHEVRNGARVLTLAGLDATLWGEKKAVDGILVAPRIRNVYPAGFEPVELSSRFHIVRNAAAQLKPVGTDMSRLGVPPLVQNTRRYFSGFRVGQTDEWGLPFIAYGVRTVGPQNPLDPVRGIIGGATIWYRVRELAPKPPDFPSWGAYGKATVDSRINAVLAKSIPPTWQWGMASLRNLTPELTPYWDSSLFTLFGATAVFNRLNWYNIEGWHAEEWGTNTIITFRTKKIVPMGLDAARYNPFHTIRNERPDPPGQQYTYSTSLGETLNMGAPQFKSLALFPTGIMEGGYGAPTLQGMSIFPHGIPPYTDDVTGTQLGVPSVPGQQTVTVKGWASDGSDDPPGFYGKPDLSPRTIWAPTGAPQQAIQNHPGNSEVVDHFLEHQSGLTMIHPFMAYHRIELKNRTYAIPSLGNTQLFGDFKSALRPIYVYPQGPKFTKYGFPVVDGGNKQVQAAGFDLSVWSPDYPKLSSPEPFIRYLRPAGLDSSGFGSTWVANFIRYPVPQGYDATQWGRPIVQRPPPPAYPPGLDATLWGAGTFIAYRIRHIDMPGWESFISEYDVTAFMDRMRVKGRSHPTITMGETLRMGMPTLNAKHRSIFPASTLPVAGAVPVPGTRRQNRVNIVSAGDQSAIGEAWSLPVLPGTIQPRGEDFSATGLPRANYQVILDGWAGELGAPRLAWPIGAEGADTAQFGEMVLMGFGCGRQARAMHGWDSATFGTAGIGQG